MCYFIIITNINEENKETKKKKMSSCDGYQMSTTSVLAVQAIADANGITLARPALASQVAQKGEEYITKFISAAGLISSYQHAQRLSAQHINRVLIADSKQPLFGYDGTPSVQFQQLQVEQTEILYNQETPRPLKQISKNEPLSLPRIQKYPFQYFIVEGVPITKKLLSNRRLVVKAPRSDKPVIPGIGINPIEIAPQIPVPLFERKYDQNQLAGDILGGDLQHIFIRTINSLRKDSSYSYEATLYELESEVAIQQLLPYFIHYIFGQMTIHFRDISIMSILLDFSAALVHNQNLNCIIYAHSFLKIALSALIGFDFSSSLITEDIKLREKAAFLLVDICHAFEIGFPSIAIHIFNKLAETIFDPNTTLQAQYGALYAIHAFGDEAINKIIPHLGTYIKYIKSELQHEDYRHSSAAQTNINRIKQIIDYVNNRDNEDTRYKKYAKQIELLINKL